MPIVSIDSQDMNYSHYPHPNKYVIKLPEVYKDVTCLSLLNIELPNSFYIFAAKYNNVTIRVSIYSPSKITRDITIPDGNYTSDTIASTLNTLLEAAFVSSFTTKIDYTTQKISITNSAGYDVEIDTTVYSTSKMSNWGLAYFLGFNKGEILRGATIKSQRQINMNPVTYIMLDIENIQNVDECNESQGNRGSFAKIPLNRNSFDYIYLDRETTSFGDKKLNPILSKLDRLAISWRFHDGTLVDFNGMEHSFSLEIITKVNKLGSTL